MMKYVQIPIMKCGGDKTLLEKIKNVINKKSKKYEAEINSMIFTIKERR